MSPSTGRPARLAWITAIVVILLGALFSWKGSDDPQQMTRLQSRVDGEGDKPATLAAQAELERRATSPSFTITVLLPDGSPATRATVWRANVGDVSELAGPEALGEEIGTTDASGRCLARIEPGQLLGARLCHLTAQRRVEAENEVTLTLDTFTPVLRVVDSRGQVLPDVLVEILDGPHEVRCEARTDATGTVRSAPLRAASDPSGFRARVLLPGANSLRPLDPASRQFPFVFSLGDVGTVEVTIEGEPERVDVSLVATRATGDHGYTAFVKSARRRVDVLVAAGEYGYALVGWSSDGRRVDVRAAGPKVCGERVQAVLDLAGVPIRGTVPALAGRDDLDVFAWAGVLHGPVRARVDASGAFAAVLPRWSGPADLYFCRRQSAAIRPGVTVHGGAIDVGDLQFERRPRLGAIEVRDGSGALVLESPLVGDARLVDGTRIAAGLRRLVVIDELPGEGAEILGLPCVVGVVLTPFRRGCFAEPTQLEVTGGGSFTARLVTGGTVRVDATHPHAGLRELWLRHVASGALVRSLSSRKQPHGQWSEFGDLPPGIYAIEGRDCEVVGSRVDVQAGSRQEVSVTVK